MLKPAENVELRTFEVEPDKKQELLEHLLDAEQGSFLVFVRTKHGADRVARRLARSASRPRRFTATVRRRSATRRCSSFSEGRHRVLVATDVAARGIDVANVAHVINFDMPKMAEDFRPPRRPHRPRLGTRRCIHVRRPSRARRPAQDRAHTGNLR